MSFVTFPSISKASQSGKCSHNSSDWIRQEKIHGANFQMIIGEDDIKFGSRSKELPPEGEPSDFFYFGKIKLFSDTIKKLIEFFEK